VYVVKKLLLFLNTLMFIDEQHMLPGDKIPPPNLGLTTKIRFFKILYCSLKCFPRLMYIGDQEARSHIPLVTGTAAAGSPALHLLLRQQGWGNLGLVCPVP
jgi:hypothetical protein